MSREYDEMDLVCAIICASAGHNVQRDKVGDIYLFHPLRIAIKMYEDGYSIGAVIAALLHDIVEDTENSKALIKHLNLNDNTLEALDALTRRQGESYDDYIQRCEKNWIAKAVKTYDILDNLGPRIDRIEDQETRERLIKKYTSIMDRWGVNYIVGSSCDLDAGSTTTDSLERT